MADLLHDRANLKEIRFRDLAQADVICCLASCSEFGGFTWYPRSLVYAGELGQLELFARVAGTDSFGPIRQLLGVQTVQALFDRLQSEHLQKILHERAFWSALELKELLNLDELARLDDGVK